MTFASVVGAMLQPIGLVLCLRLPVQMNWTDARFMAFTARVGSLMLGSWRSPVGEFANVAGGNDVLAINPKQPVTVSIFTEIPGQAVF